jgi:hypothetical protein
MAEESLNPSVLCPAASPPWTHGTGVRQAKENRSACVQEIFSQDNKLLAQLLTVPASAAGSRPTLTSQERGRSRKVISSLVGQGTGVIDPA